MRLVVLVSSVMLVVGATAQAAHPQAASNSASTFPTRPVRLMVSTTPGSPSDVIARLVGAKLTEIWGQQVVIDNRPGATGHIAADTMSQLIATLQAQRHLLATDFAPVTLVASTPFLIIVPQRWEKLLREGG